MTAGAPSFVTELALSLQFGAINNLSVVDLAKVRDRFLSEFPVFQQVPQLPPISSEITTENTINLITGPHVELPRIWMISEDLQWLVQFQTDRLAFNWRQIDPASHRYPGYDTVEERFFECWNQISAWSNSTLGVPLSPAVGEINYVNTIPMQEGDRKRRMSEVFSFFRPLGSPRLFGNFSANWLELIQGGGHVQVQAHIGQLPNGTPTANLALVGRFGIEGDTSAVRRTFQTAHKHIYESYLAVVTIPSEGTE